MTHATSAGAKAADGPISIPMPENVKTDLKKRLQTPTPTDPLAAETLMVAENMEPASRMTKQAAEAKKKLDALAKKTGKKPNVLIFLMDNVGYGDLGINGGGLMAGAPTPNMDRLGHEGLQLLSTYSQPSCTPCRCTLLTGRLPMRHGQLRPELRRRIGLAGR